MSDEQNTNTPPPGNDPGKNATDLKAELREMGQQIETALRTFIESERAKQLQDDLARGVREVSSQVRTAVQNLQSDPRVAQAEERGRQAIHQARESKVVQDLQDTLVVGLSELNSQLSKLVQRLEEDNKRRKAAPSSQNVPVEQEPPATSETRKLDE